MRGRGQAVLVATLMLAMAGIVAPAVAQDVTLKDAVNCKDFVRNADGSWHTDGVTLNYGAGGKQQINYFGEATIKQPSSAAKTAPDLWSVLNDKCGAH